MLEPTTRLPFVNADVIADERWPDAQLEHAYDASRAAAALREQLLAEHRSFLTETVFSHPSKLELLRTARRLGYLVNLHVMLVPEDLTVARVEHRVARGGHAVPEEKIRERYSRLWPLVAQARDLADLTSVYDNSRAAEPFRLVATYERGVQVGDTHYPVWTPPAVI